MEDIQPPRVTALIVCRNQAEALRRCLQALEQSVGRDRLEVLVVDDGSDDESADIPSDFDNVIALRLPKRLGYTRAVNIGLGTAKGEMVLLLPAEYVVRPETVGALADRLESNHDVGAVCPAVDRAWSFPTPEALSEAWRTGDLPGAITPDSGETAVDYPKGAPILIRRQLLRAMNWLDKRFGSAWSDLEMCSRIRNGNKKIIVERALPVERQPPQTDALTEIEWVDSAHGIATWIGIHYGTPAALKFRTGAAFHALGHGKLGVFLSILSFSKIDGNQ